MFIDMLSNPEFDRFDLSSLQKGKLGLFSRSAERSELLIESEARSAESRSDVARRWMIVLAL